MESTVQQACCPSKTRHDIEIFDRHVCPAFANTVEHRHDDNAVSFVVYRHPNITVVGPGDGTHPRIRLVVPGVVCILGLVIHFDEGLPLVELSEKIQEVRPGKRLGRKAPADIDDAAYDRDVTGREVQGIRLRRDSWVSVMYAEELNSTKSSDSLQRTDRHGILGQKPSGFQESL